MKDTCLVGFNSGVAQFNTASAYGYLQEWIRANTEMKYAAKGSAVHIERENTLLLVAEGVWRLWVGQRKTLGVLVPGGMLWLDLPPANYPGATSRCEGMTCSRYYEAPIRLIRQSPDSEILLAGILEFASFNSRTITNMWLDQCVNDSYRKIRFALERMIELPESIRLRLSAISYVMDTTGISRSHALSIMKSLKEGGYIDIDSGYLMGIAKKMPMAY